MSTLLEINMPSSPSGALKSMPKSLRLMVVVPLMVRLPARWPGLTAVETKIILGAAADLGQAEVADGEADLAVRGLHGPGARGDGGGGDGGHVGTPVSRSNDYSSIVNQRSELIQT